MRFDGGMPSVEQIKAEVLREFRQDSRIRWADIGVEVRDCTVTLTGTVASTSEVLAALEAANRADGLFYVDNQLRVKADGRPTDQEITGAVRGALERDEMIPERAIQVAVSNGWVALNGRVERTREREEAERIARRAAGVRGVYNLIEVSPPATRVERTLDAAAVTVQPLAAGLQSAPLRVA
ncbi:MAG TPA: BON domain-containing protein [Pyrinomonadaceae bacterium]|jgi:osmotically-inducible protein OsmY